MERFHEALEQLPPTTVLASDSVAASAEKNTDPAFGLEDDSIDEVLGVSLDEIRELPFWKEPADTGTQHTACPSYVYSYIVFLLTRVIR